MEKFGAERWKVSLNIARSYHFRLGLVQFWQLEKK
jgi:hypothetical protein